VHGSVDMELNDEDLLERYVSGDVNALEQLVERYRRPLYSFILRMTEAPGDADEVFQEIWLRVIRNANGYRRDRFRGWLFRIGHNLIIDRARGHRKTVSMDETPAGGSELTLADKLPDAGLDPVTIANGRDLGRRMAEALKTLPGDQREVFLLRSEADMSFRDIARIQKVSINTALARMQYALTKLRKVLREEYEGLA
jgi:RNA polymerase sigma-70 factor, ECF subfamily